jgi:chemotaxis response regulator CheB
MNKSVLIVDDSASIRQMLGFTLWSAGYHIEMPHMNGLSLLEKPMAVRPTPVVVISSLTETGAEATFRAMELGPWTSSSNPNSESARACRTMPI